MPNCWTAVQFDSFQKQYPWIRCVESGNLESALCSLRKLLKIFFELEVSMQKSKSKELCVHPIKMKKFVERIMQPPLQP